MRLLGQCLCDCHVWLFDHGSECAPLEHVGLVGAPHRRHWRGHAFHAVFKLSSAHLFRHVFGEDYLEVLFEQEGADTPVNYAELYLEDLGLSWLFVDKNKD